MARARLTDEERLARKKERSAKSFSDAAYNHFDPKVSGYGSIDEWLKAADALAGGRGSLRTEYKRDSIHEADLALLFLDELPSDIAGLKRAYRNTLFIVHPDKGGSTEEAQAVNAAYGRLVKLY